jgi:hypothetical protein
MSSRHRKPWLAVFLDVCAEDSRDGTFTTLPTMGSTTRRSKNRDAPSLLPLSYPRPVLDLAAASLPRFAG